ncbi:MAG: hypothetical protein ABSE67_21745, partial [Xanthobacteraceae bacterium]
PLTTKRKQTTPLLSKTRKPLNVIHGNARFTKFNKDRGDPSGAPAAINAFEFAMMSYLTSAWTLFETAAGDLWEAALNHRPHGLADLRGERRYQRRETRRSSDDSGKLEKSVKLDLIRAEDWDTRNKMGTILRPKFAFTTLQGIRDAYEAAFYKKVDDIDQIVTDDC